MKDDVRRDDILKTQAVLRQVEGLDVDTMLLTIFLELFENVSVVVRCDDTAPGPCTLRANRIGSDAAADFHNVTEILEKIPF